MQLPRLNITHDLPLFASLRADSTSEVTGVIVWLRIHLHLPTTGAMIEGRLFKVRPHDIILKLVPIALRIGLNFLTNVTSASIADELEDVRTDLRILVSRQETKIDDFRAGAAALRGFYTTILQDPLSGLSIPMIRRGWAALDTLEAGECQMSLLLRLQQSCIMLTNYTAWYWLDVCILDRCNYIMDNAGDCDINNWLVRLVTNVQDAYKLRYKRHRYTSSSYGINIPTATFEFVNEHRNAPEGQALRVQVISTVERILRSWLHYPQSNQCRLQAWLVHVLVHSFGRQVLYLNSIWKTYSGARRRSIDTHSWHISSFKDVTPLRLVATDHPLFDKNSNESNALSEMATLIDDFTAGKLRLRPRTDKSTTITDRMPHQLGCTNERRVKVFTQFVMDCLSIFFRHDTANTKLKTAIAAIPNKLMPFREHAPSRLRIRGNNGPFSAAYARTTAGAYSAVVWRGITFGTLFSMNNRMVFTSYDDFKSACMEADRQDARYFCDKGAYGQSNPMRDIELAKAYWKTLADGKWKGFVKDRIVPFLECYHFFMAGKTPPDFPQLGPLASYLLTADFSYCEPKVVESPTQGEMAVVIQLLNKGAIAGLENLGFITPRVVNGKRTGKADLDECEVAIGRVYNLLKDIIPAEHHQAVNLDLIMTEHTLCKFSRVVGMKLIEPC